MIKTRNLGDYKIHLKAAGEVAAGANKDVAKVPFDGWLANVVASFSSITGNTNSVVDINYLGTSIFGGTARITLSTLSNTPTYNTLSTDPLPVTAGSLFTMDVDSVSTTLTNLIVDLVITRTPPAKTTTLSNLDGVI